ncbi:pentatricopeptide repeat-containing protein at1g26900 mitochondrial [Phtheirospermum japonicum]|uniref:Pentatricopeptide repeat-containing protein at1g26900 mitochondrial n=1 Tax=Phtheirospermum japonicum TaxID=374723 RepID=A0A830CZD8_9LAMI|nr:pentatricopeptide repeat-containing protein at1g26900 mitochondrial [Phtheirospermum japonicum]
MDFGSRYSGRGLRSSGVFVVVRVAGSDLVLQRMKSIPVVDLGEAKIDNVITQIAVIHMLEECAGLHWFESWCSKKLFELGLPLMKTSHIVKVHEDEPVLQAFKLMRQNGVGGVPMVASGGNKAIGNISIRDIQFLLIAPEIYKEYRHKPTFVLDFYSGPQELMSFETQIKV